MESVVTLASFYVDNYVRICNMFVSTGVTSSEFALLFAHSVKF